MPKKLSRPTRKILVSIYLEDYEYLVAHYHGHARDSSGAKLPGLSGIVRRLVSEKVADLRKLQ